MLAYRHAFHAGNHAHVLKHIVLLELPEHLSQRDAAYRVIDTHAGAGSYSLHAWRGGAQERRVSPRPGVPCRWLPLKAQAPPSGRRGLVLMDSAYDGVGDYPAVLHILADVLKRFAEGIYMVWYPLVQKPQARSLPQRLKALPSRSWLHSQLSVQQTDAPWLWLDGQRRVHVQSGAHPGRVAGRGAALVGAGAGAE